jgi:4-amino-4-deoxy-L-arabinose transferase-like glycosyltransferase
MPLSCIRSLPIWEKLSSKKRLIFIFLLCLLGLAGIGLLAYVTPYGVGIYVDTLYYVTSAKNLLNGIGMGRLTGNGVYKPMTHYPPLYALVLAFTQVLGLDMLAGARWVSMLAFGLAVLLAGWIVWQRTGSTFFSLATAFLVLGSGVLLRTFSWAMSEPLYIVLELSGFLLLAVYFKASRRGWLVAASLAIGLALLTRYVGFSLVAVFTLALLVNRSLKRPRRFMDIGLFLFLSLLPSIIWFIRNRLVSGTLANRVISWHPITEEKFASLVKAVLSWGLVPQRLAIGRETLAFSFIAAVLMIASLIWLFRNWPRQGAAPAQEFTLQLSCWAYLGLLAVSLNWIDATTPLDNRILMPLYLNILLLLGIGMALLWQRPGLLPRLMAVGMLLWFSYFTLTRLDGAVLDLTRDGQDYASLEWKSSPTIQFIREQDPPLVYTNDVTAIYFLAGKDSVGIPNFKSNEAEFQGMRESLRSTGGFLVLFGTLTGEFASQDEITQGMTLVGQFEDGVVYQNSP